MAAFARSGGTKGENIKIRGKQTTCCTIPSGRLPPTLVESVEKCKSQSLMFTACRHAIQSIGKTGSQILVDETSPPPLPCPSAGRGKAGN